MTTLTSKLLRGSIIAGIALAPVSALAQSTTPDSDTGASGMTGAQTEMAPQATPDATQPDTDAAPEMAADFSDTQLEHFVDATMKMQEVRSDYIPQIEAAESDADKAELAQQAQTEMAAAVEATEGLDVQTYNEIGRAAQADQALNARLVAMLQDRAASTAEPRDEG